jgi:hypothetical protein
MTATFLIVVLAAPLLWSAAIVGIRRLFADEAQPDDQTEKRYLLILLAPVLLGPVAAAIAHWLPLPVHLATTRMIVATTAATGGTGGQGAPTWHMVIAWLVPACLVFYALGLAVKAVPLALQFLTLHRIVGEARTSSIAPDVRLTEAAVPPLSWRRGTVLLPQGLVTQLAPAQIDLLIAHERAHIQRGDVAWYALLSWIDAIFWFNPFIRNQTALCRLAAELACDAAVTRATPEMREVYAACLLTTLKHAAGDALACAPAVFSNSNSGEFKMRMTEIMRKSAPPRKPRWLMQSAVALLILPLAGVQYAWSQDTAAKPTAAQGAPGCVLDGKYQAMAGTANGACMASADHWQKDDATHTVTLSGNAQLTTNGKVFHADSMQWDNKTGQVTFNGPVTVTDAPPEKVALVTASGNASAGNAASVHGGNVVVRPPEGNGSGEGKTNIVTAPNASSDQAGKVRIVRPSAANGSGNDNTNMVTVPGPPADGKSGAVIIIQPKGAADGNNRIVVMPLPVDKSGGSAKSVGSVMVVSPNTSSDASVGTVTIVNPPADGQGAAVPKVVIRRPPGSADTIQAAPQDPKAATTAH